MTDRRQQPVSTTHVPRVEAAEKSAEAPWRRRFDALLDAAVDAIVVIDARGSILRFNRAAETIFGHLAAEVLGKNVSILMPEPYRSAHDSYIRTFQATRQPKIIGIGREVEALRADGSVFPIELSVGHVEIEGADQYLGIIRDVSARKAAEEELRQKDEVIRLSFEKAPLAAFTRDREGRFLSVNRAMCDLLGYQHEELLVTDAIEVVHPEDREEAHAVAVRLEHGEVESEIHQRRLLRKDGSVVFARVHLSVVHDDRGRPAMEIAQIENETERRRLEHEATDLRERLAHVGRLGTMGEMATGIAHEINQPLTAIANYAQACRYGIVSGAASQEGVLDMLSKITQGAKRAGEVIRRLRSMVRKRKSEREELGINELVADVVRLAEIDARLHDIDLTLDLGEPSCHVLADGVQIQQVVLNLIHNGLESMSELPADDQQLVVRTRCNGSTVEIAIADRGAGLSTEDAEQLFQPFYSTKKTGLGMGLTICRSIVEGHGGRLWFSRNDDRGTIFHVSLPLLGAESA